MGRRNLASRPLETIELRAVAVAAAFDVAPEEAVVVAVVSTVGDKDD